MKKRKEWLDIGTHFVAGCLFASVTGIIVVVLIMLILSHAPRLFFGVRIDELLDEYTAHIIILISLPFFFLLFNWFDRFWDRLGKPKGNRIKRHEPD